MSKDVVIFERHPRWMWVTKFLFWCIVIGLLAFAVTGCGGTAGLFGLASVQDVNAKSAQIQKYADEVAANEAAAKQAETHAAIEMAFAPLEPLLPGIRKTVREMLEGKPTIVPAPTPRPEPVPDNSVVGKMLAENSGNIGLGILTIIGIIEGMRRAKKQAVEVAVKRVNTERDARRKERGEALTPAEAKAKGYFDEGAPRAG
jgi:outer membrane murein-binding lipoprotein Lpp